MSNADTGADYPYVELPTIQLSNYSVSLIVDDVAHAHTVDGDLLLEMGLAVDNCTHAHDAESVTMSGVNYTLVVANCTHAHQAASVDFPITVQGRRLWVKVNGHWVQITPATG
jgi:aminoglycoside N3'-acetyltransferase